MKDQKQKPCPNCNQYTLRSSKAMGCIVIVVALGTVFFFMFIPPLLILSIIIFVAGVLSMIAPTSYECMNCHYKIKP